MMKLKPINEMVIGFVDQLSGAVQPYSMVDGFTVYKEKWVDDIDLKCDLYLPDALAFISFLKEGIKKRTGVSLTSLSLSMPFIFFDNSYSSLFVFDGTITNKEDVAKLRKRLSNKGQIIDHTELDQYLSCIKNFPLLSQLTEGLSGDFDVYVNLSNDREGADVTILVNANISEDDMFFINLVGLDKHLIDKMEFYENDLYEHMETNNKIFRGWMRVFYRKGLIDQTFEVEMPYFW